MTRWKVQQYGQSEMTEKVPGIGVMPEKTLCFKFCGLTIQCHGIGLPPLDIRGADDHTAEGLFRLQRQDGISCRVCKFYLRARTAGTDIDGQNSLRCCPSLSHRDDPCRRDRPYRSGSTVL